MVLVWKRTAKIKAGVVQAVRRESEIGLAEAYALVHGVWPGNGDSPAEERRLAGKSPWSEDDLLKLATVLQDHGYDVTLEEED